MSEEVEKGHVFVIAAPSGTGKTTICNRIIEGDTGLEFSVSHTTRTPREGERDGAAYHFVNPKAFRELVEAGAFLEHAEYGGNAYGTSWATIEGPLDAGRDVVLEIEVQGAEQVRNRMSDACLIFLLPPSMAILEARLRGRGTDDENAIQQRMALVDRELEAARYFDFAVVNDDLELAVRHVLDLIEGIRQGGAEALGEVHGRAMVLACWEAAQEHD